MKAYVFPGQGAQKKGMGEGLFDEFSDLTGKADEILGYSIKELCTQDPENKLNLTQFTQPALYTVCALSYLKKTQSSTEKPAFFAGHSLGEYGALFAAGVFTFETGLSLVKERGELMSKAKQGAMAAIIGSSEQIIKEILQEANLTTIDIANYNSTSQIIISGLKEDIEKSQSFFEKAKARFVPLNTSGAFHSRYMKEAADNFESTLKQFEFLKPQIPVLSNVTALPHEDNIAQRLVEQMYNSVRWTECVQYLLDNGVTDFEEIGVGDVLTKLIVQIKKEHVSKNKNSDTTNAATAKTEKRITEVSAWTIEGLEASEIVDKWNKAFPVGTKVKSSLYDNDLETRTEATVLFGHRAAVYMKGYNGYFDLREVTPC